MALKSLSWGYPPPTNSGKWRFRLGALHIKWTDYYYYCYFTLSEWGIPPIFIYFRPSKHLMGTFVETPSPSLKKWSEPEALLSHPSNSSNSSQPSQIDDLLLVGLVHPAHPLRIEHGTTPKKTPRTACCFWRKLCDISVPNGGFMFMFHARIRPKCHPSDNGCSS